MNRTSLNGIEYIESNPGADKAIILLHGYGANAADLYSLSSYLNLQQSFRFIFPEGILDLGYGAKAWFHIDESALQQAMAMGVHRDFRNLTPPGFLEASSTLQNFVKELKIDLEHTIIGGFSQGAMLATEIALELDSLQALVILSGALLHAEKWRSMLQNRSSMPVFQSHGKGDMLLSFVHAKELHEMISASKHAASWCAFAGGHEIPGVVLEQLSEFINKL